MSGACVANPCGHHAARAASRSLRSGDGASGVSGTGVVANVVGGVLALLLIIYLFVALVRPEKF